MNQLYALLRLYLRKSRTTSGWCLLVGILIFSLNTSAQILPCAISTTALSGTCNPATNLYTVTGTISLTNTASGTATITDGTSSMTVAVAANATSIPYSLSGLVSNGASHTVIVSLPTCGTAQVTYAAPVSCSVAAVCFISAVATASVCNTATNTYSSTVVVTVSNPNGTAPVSCSVAPLCSVSATATASGCNTATNTYSSTVVVTVSNPNGNVLSVTNRGVTQTLSTTANTSNTLSFVFNGLVSDGTSYTTTASLPGCGSATAAYTAPVSCTIAATPRLAVTVTPGTCNPATNKYSVSGTLSLTNATASTVTLTDGTVTTTVAITAGQTSASFSLTGLSSGLGTHTVTAQATGYAPASATYSAPASCTLPVTSFCLLTVTPTIGQCTTVTNGTAVSSVFSSTVNVQFAVGTPAGTLMLSDGTSTTTIAVCRQSNGGNGHLRQPHRRRQPS